MEGYRNISDCAKELVKTKSKEAFILYQKLWSEFPNEFNGWDGMYLIQSAKLANFRSYIDILPIVEKFKDDEKVTGNYGWYVFDLFVKGKTKEQLRSNERPIKSLALHGKQKDFTKIQEYPCPFTLCVFKLIDAFSTQASFNASKIKYLLTFVKPELLSAEEESFKDKEGKEVKNASIKEKYYSRLSKALDKLNDYNNCKIVSEDAMKSLTHFHNDNDLWFPYRIAKSESRLGNIDISKELFENLLKTRVGASKWFIFKEIAEIYFKKKEYNKANTYSIRGLLIGEEVKLTKELFVLQAQIFFKLNEMEHVTLIANVLNSYFAEQESSKISNESIKLINYCGLKPQDAKPLKESLREAKELFIAIKYQNIEKLKGEIISVSRNGKSGVIKTPFGEKYGFRKMSFLKRQKDLESLKGAKTIFYPSEDYEGKSIADVIEVEEKPKSNSSMKEGQLIKGKINGVTELGIFVAFNSGEKGLLHKSKLSEGFQGKYSKGELINVKINKINEKGLDLLLNE